ILPSATFQEILSDSKTLFSSDLLPRWVLKYSVLIKHRGVVADKGYIVMASASNSDS
ncbi:1551_t:CDS:2, partial [Acaulospora morrowiae]